MPIKSYVGSGLNDPSILRNSTHVDFSNKNLDNVRFVKLNSLPAVWEHLSPEIYVDEAISDGEVESSLFRLDPDEKLDLDEQDSLLPNSTLTTPKTIVEIPTESYVGRLHEIDRNQSTFIISLKRSR